MHQTAASLHPSATSCPRPPAGSVAYLDESYEPSGPYVLAAVVVADAAAAVRQQLATLAHPTRGRYHFSKETHEDRMRGAAVVAELDVPLVVVVRTGEAKPERAQGICLPAMLWQLHGRVEHLVLESRMPAENTRDSQTITGQRPRCCTPLTYSFLPAQDDPLLWSADIVASSGFQARARQRPEYFDVLSTGPVETYDV